MKKVLCISTKERRITHWSHAFKVGKIYRVAENDQFGLRLISKKPPLRNQKWYVDRECFIDMKLVWSAIAFFFVLLFAMTGESIVDYILKTLFGL